jgi:class I fructose-bisphosphate aldolase
MVETFFEKPVLSELDLSLGKRIRLHRMLYEFGPANGTLLILPIDQGIEHGPMDFFPNPESKDPLYQFNLAVEAGFSAIACHIGLVQKYGKKFAGKIPIILKINGKTNIPSDKNAFSPLTATVKDAVRLGADAVGYTLYVGSPWQHKDIAQLNKVRLECEKFGMPLIVWSYPRGEAIELKGGRDSLYAVDYAARMANELNAEIVKLNVPKKLSGEKLEAYKKFLSKDKLLEHYLELEKASNEERMKRVVKSAGKTFVLVSGGGKLSDKDLVEKTEFALKAGVTGLIYGRNMWQRPFNEAIELTEKIKKMLAKYGR